MGTISDLNEVTAPNPALDYLLVRTTSPTDKDKKMKVGVFPLKYQTPAVGKIAQWRDANTLEASGAAVTGTGTLALGANTLTVNGNSSINGAVAGNLTGNVTGTVTGGGTLALGTNTLTVPATGTAALKTGTPVLDRVATWADANTVKDSTVPIADVGRLSVGQTYSGANIFTPLQTFNGGLKMSGGSTLTRYEVGTFPPVVADAATGGTTTTPTSATGNYVIIGDLCTVSVAIFNVVTTGMVAANALYIRNLPFVSYNSVGYSAVGAAIVHFATFTGYVVAYLSLNTSAVRFVEHASAAAAGFLTCSDFQSGLADIEFTLTYKVN